MVAPQNDVPCSRGSFDNYENPPTVKSLKPTFRFLVLANDEFSHTTFVRQIRNLSNDDAVRWSSKGRRPVSRHWSLNNVKRIFSFLHKNYQKLSRTSSYIVNMESDSNPELRNGDQYNFNSQGYLYSFTYYNDSQNYEDKQELLDSIIDRWSKENETSKNFVLFVVPLTEVLAQYEDGTSKNPLDNTINRFQRLLNNEKLKDTTFILFFNDEESIQKMLTKELYKDLKLREHISKADSKYSTSKNKKALTKKFQDAMADTTKRDDALYCRFTNATDKGCLKAIKDIVKIKLLNELIESN